MLELAHSYYLLPEPTALQSTTDHNQTVRLHHLCTLCERWVDKSYRLISDDSSNANPDYSTECKHYRSSLELATSSERGCHLCSILWARLQAEASMLESLRLLESHLRASFMRTLGLVPHSYALRVHRDLPTFGDAALVLYYPPKRHEYGESEELRSLLKTCLMNGDSRDIFSIEMHTIPCMCISYVDRQAFKC